MTKYGLVAMSAKPYHAGHDGLVRLAAAENDIVKLYVSTSDRKRRGELPISGAVMAEIWTRFIEPSLPGNVQVEYGGSPIRKVYQFLGAENEAGSDDRYVIYSDPEDMARNFPQRNLEKYVGDIYNRGNVQLEPIHRTATVDISGTQMRAWLEQGDSESFIAHLPGPLRPHGEEIWTMLIPGTVGESFGYGFSESSPRVPRRANLPGPTKKKAKKTAGLEIVGSSKGMLRYSGLKRGGIRLVATDPSSRATDDQIQQIFGDAGYSILSIRPPYQGLSSKFPTYSVLDRDTRNTFDVIVGIGRNAGQAYEDELSTELQALSDTGSGSKRVLQMLKHLKIDPGNVSAVHQASGKRVRRPLTGELRDVGEMIADITIELKSGGVEYISLKNRQGVTFANVGYKGGFEIVPTGRQNVEVVARPHPLDEFVEALGVDKDVAAEGFTSYANAKLRRKKHGEPTPSIVGGRQNFKTVSRYLESAFGYGYWYVREGKGGKFDVKDLRKPEQIRGVVGDISNITLRYPGRSKQITAKIETTLNVFEVEIRNSQGLIDPNEIKIRIK